MSIYSTVPSLFLTSAEAQGSDMKSQQQNVSVYEQACPDRHGRSILACQHFGRGGRLKTPFEAVLE